MPKTYADAEKLYFEWSKRKRRSANCKLAHNTTLEAWERQQDGRKVFAVRLHDTFIVMFNQDDSIELDSGGWQTVTTRDRMNRCGVKISMSGGIVSVLHGAKDWVYRNGMTLNPDDTVTYREGQEHWTTDASAVRKLRRRELARARRAGEYAWRWPTRQGGRAIGGNAPEAFKVPQ
jgi:hypothetical protein